MKNYIFLLSIFFTLPSFAYDRITGESFATRSEVIATNGMAATSHPLATQTAIDVLKNGGNAIDAAIAANAVLGLVEPTGCGIGGDLFAIVWSAKDKKLYGLNASGPAPQTISIETLKEKGLDMIPPYGPLPVTVPGAVAGWSALHKRFGKRDFSTLFDNAIDYANNGFPVSEVVAYYLDISSSRFKDYPNFSDVWMPKNKSLQKELLDFLLERLKYYMKEENIRNDIIQASINSSNLDQSVTIFNKAKNLNKIINKQNGIDIISSYKRASNILESELKKDKIELSNSTDPGIFKTELEKNLFKKINELRKYFSSINNDENFVQTLDNLASIKREVFDFFDNVIVNEEDLVIKKNRL